MTGWANRKRLKRKAENRRKHHQIQLDGAETPRQRLWAACGWLISEAYRAGEIDEVTELVLDKVREIRDREIAGQDLEEEVHDDRYDYAG